MKLIFLDVDGVLNKFSTKERVLNYFFHWYIDIYLRFKFDF